MNKNVLVTLIVGLLVFLAVCPCPGEEQKGAPAAETQKADRA